MQCLPKWYFGSDFIGTYVIRIFIYICCIVYPCGLQNMVNPVQMKPEISCDVSIKYYTLNHICMRCSWWINIHNSINNRRRSWTTYSDVLSGNIFITTGVFVKFDASVIHKETTWSCWINSRERAHHQRTHWADITKYHYYSSIMFRGFGRNVSSAAPDCI